jgi:hypothetical protein
MAIGLMVAGLAAPVQAGDHDRAPTTSAVYNLEYFSEVPDSRAFLHRRDDRARLDLKTYADPGSAYTIWMINFNNPDACTHPSGGDLLCGPGDDGPFNGTGFSVAWAAGGVADPITGELHLKSGWFDEGTAPGQVLFPFGSFGDETDVLTDAEAVEMHVIAGPTGPHPRIRRYCTHRPTTSREDALATSRPALPSMSRVSAVTSR